MRIYRTRWDWLKAREGGVFPPNVSFHDAKLDLLTSLTITEILTTRILNSRKSSIIIGLEKCLGVQCIVQKNQQDLNIVKLHSTVHALHIQAGYDESMMTHCFCARAGNMDVHARVCVSHCLFVSPCLCDVIGNDMFSCGELAESWRVWPYTVWRCCDRFQGIKSIPPLACCTSARRKTAWSPTRVQIYSTRALHSQQSQDGRLRKTGKTSSQVEKKSIIEAWSIKNVASTQNLELTLR